MEKKAIRIFFPLHHSGTFKGWFSSVLFLWKKHFFKKMLGQVLVKKSSFLGTTLNLHRGKTVKFFTLFQVHMIPMVKISQTNKKQSSLSCLCPEIWCGKNMLFFQKRVILWAPTVHYREKKAAVKTGFLWQNLYKIQIAYNMEQQTSFIAVTVDSLFMYLFLSR
jgi:hypothetical protein